MRYKNSCINHAPLVKRGVFFVLLGLLCLFWGSLYPKYTAFAENKKEENPYGWDKISAYTTYFNQNDGGRCENIAIAASLIDGITIQPYGEFSFNGTVGRRTAEAGFQQAKIILNGEYVLGVGGGVCQVSTTLYNAALKSGLTATEFHPHSLLVGYVPPSRDAMVSSQSDLKLFNPRAHAVYLSAKVENGAVKITFYGKNDGDRYEIISKTLSQIPPPKPIVKDGAEDGVLREEKCGTKSESYLERYRGNQLLERKKLREDVYSPIQGIISKKSCVFDTENAFKRLFFSTKNVIMV